MKNKWNKIFNTLTAADAELRAYLSACGNAAKLKPFVKQWETLKTDANEIDAVMSADPVEIKTPFKDASVSETWATWKAYLLEQHGIVMRSRSERAALDLLYKWSAGNPEKAVYFVNYAMSFQYRSFFKVSEKDEKTPANDEYDQF